MSTHREAQSRTVAEIEEIIERAVTTLGAKRVPRERNEISINSSRAKALPHLDVEQVPIRGFVIKGSRPKIASPEEWLQDALDSLSRLAGPGLYRAGFRFPGKGATTDGVYDECVIQLGGRSVLKSEKMEICNVLNRGTDAYTSGNISVIADQFRRLCGAAAIPMRVSVEGGQLVFDAPSHIKFRAKSSYGDQPIPNELIIEVGWNPDVRPAESLARIALEGARSTDELEGVWECIVNHQADTGSDPSRLYDLLRSKPPQSNQMTYYVRLLIPDVETCERVLKETKVRQASLRLADMNLPDPKEPDDPDMTCWLTLGAAFKKGEFYLELEINHSQKQFLRVVNAALGTQFR